MRFIEDGPDIPDELLLALDEGKVMFFCGAGVSCAKANLPNFIGLAENVLEQLRVSKDDPADKILKLARNEPEEKTKTIEEQLGVSNFVSSDLIFSELEKDFETHDIETAVAMALNPPKGVCLKAHEIMLGLSTIKAGHTRLVTTNFDRLFEKCNSSLNAWQPPRLPDSNEISTFQGVVYLHGAANKKYNGSDSSFILSSAEFGRAYLAEGWATQFFKDIISKYTVVFIGYSADDPPIRYLLEALNKSSDKPNKIYAFHSGTQEQAEKKWEHKGVSAIAYDSHARLWSTLGAWSERVRDIKTWQDGIIKMARKGPRQLSPFQREQVVQFVLTKEGAQSFCTSNNPPPASWLCVFDKTVRFERPYPMIQAGGSPYSLDLFERYKLDSDPEPEYIDPNDYLTDRNIPKEALDVFAVNNRDKNEIQNNPVVPMRGENALSAGNLPARLSYLGEWIAKISNQNIAVWWVARQAGIHPYVQRRIKYLLQDKTGCALHILHAWQYIFDNWTPKPDDMGENGLEWHSFEKNVEKFGWGKPTIRRYEELTKPRMLTKARYWHGAIKPPQGGKINFRQLIDLEVVHSTYPEQIKISDECLVQIVAVWRRNIDMAIRLEKERGYYGSIRPLIIQNAEGERYTHDLTDMVLCYIELLEQLLKHNLQRAQEEIKTWNKEDNNVYARLRIWACQFPELVPNDELGYFFIGMGRDFFWDFSHEHDLLFTLKACWSRIPVPAKRAIEKLLLQGYEKPDGQEEQKYILYKARGVLMRLDWLKDNGCVLDIDYDKETALLQKDDPQFKKEYTESLDRSTDGLVHRVISKTDPSVLCGLSFSEILDKSEKEINRHDDFSVEHDPFSGLCKVQPVRALAVLRYEAEQGNHRPWAWRKFLYREGCKDDPERMKRFIAEMLFRLPDEVAAEIIHALVNWVSKTSEQLTPPCIPVFECLTKRLVKVMHQNHKLEDFNTRTEGSDYDWGFQAINSSAGILAESLFGDLRIKGLKANQSPPLNWINLAQDMLNLPDDLGRYALLTFTYRLNWFYYINPQWTQDNLLQPLFDEDPDTTDAWWAGYLSGARQSPAPALFEKTKPYLLTQAFNQNAQTRDNNRKIAQLVLLSWAYKGRTKPTRHITDEEFRKILLNASDEFRSIFLQQIKNFCKEDKTSHWDKKRLALVKNVWPLQKRIKTPKTSGGLIDLAFSDEQAFPRLTKTILPLLGENPQVSMSSFLYGANKDHIIDKHPKIVLEILYKIVPEDDFLIFYRIKQMLDRIATADPKLKHDPRFIELAERCDLG